MAEQEVTVKMDVAWAKPPADPLKEAARAAAAADKALKGLGQTGSAATDQEEKYQKLLRGRTDLYRAAGRSRDDLAKSAQREISDEERYQRLLERRVKQLNEAKRLKADLERQGHGGEAQAPPRSGLMALAGHVSTRGALAIGTSLPWGGQVIGAALGAGRAIDAVRDIQTDSLDRHGRYSDPRFMQAVGSRVNRFGSFGRGLAYWSDQFFGTGINAEIHRGAMADTRLRGEMLGQHTALAGFGALSERDAALRGMNMEGALARHRLAQGTGLGESFALARQSFASTEAALRGAGRTPGYRREDEEADIARRGAVELALRQQALTSGRQLSTLDVEAGVAGRQRGEIEAGVRAQRGRVAQARAFAGRGGQTEDEARLTSVRLETELVKLGEQEKQLAEAVSREKEVQGRREEALRTSAEQRVGILRQEHETVSRLAQQERSKLRGSQERFGLLKPLERNAALQISRKIAQDPTGRGLSAGELEFARGHGDLFGDALGRIGAANAGPGFAEFMRNLGGDQRLNQLEGTRTQIENRITAEIKVDERSLSDQLVQQIVPRIYELIEGIQSRFRNEMERNANDLNRQRNAAMGPG